MLKSSPHAALGNRDPDRASPKIAAFVQGTANHGDRQRGKRSAPGVVAPQYPEKGNTALLQEIIGLVRPVWHGLKDPADQAFIRGK